MFFTSKTRESKLKERLQRWGSQGRSDSGTHSPISLGSSVTDQDTQTTSSSRNISPTAFDTDNVDVPSKEYIGSIIESKPIDNNINISLTEILRPVTPEMKQTTFGMFLQGSKDGSFTPLDCFGDWMDKDNLHHYQDVSSPTVNNSSILAVRYNADQSRSMRDHKFQWYRSTVPVRNPDTSSSTTHNIDYVNHDDTYWRAIFGATRFVYQPSVTDCGYHLKCEIHIEEHSDDDSKRHLTHGIISSYRCILIHSIELDPNILSEAQKSLEGCGNSASASFDHLLGCGLAEGKVFRLVIEQGYAKYPIDENYNRLASNLTIYQVSGNTEISLHDIHTPIFYITAEADASRSNIFYLILPIEMPPHSASAIQSLCLNRRLELYAEDRFTREVCMTALGLANINGHHSTVTVNTPLFCFSDVPDEPPICTPARLSPIPRSVAIHTKNLFPNEVGKTEPLDLYLKTKNDSKQVDAVKVVSNLSSSFVSIDRQPPSLHQPFQSRSSSLNMNQEAIELKVRIDELERSLKQKDCDLVQFEKTIEIERKKCGELREALNAAEQRIDFMYEDRILMRKDLLEQISSLERSLATSQELLVDRNKLMISLESRNSLLSATIESKNQEIIDLSLLKRQIVEFSHVVTERDNLLLKLQEMHISEDFISQLQSRLHESETRLEQNNATLVQVEEQRRLNQDLQQMISDLQLRIHGLEDSIRQKDDHIQAHKLELDFIELQKKDLELTLLNTRNQMEVLRNEEIIKRDDLLLRLSSLEQAVETHADVVQKYEMLIVSLEEEKAALLYSKGDKDDDVNKMLELKKQLDEISAITMERDYLLTEIDRLRSHDKSDLQGRLIVAEKTIQELDSMFIQYNEEKRKREEFQVAMADLIDKVKQLESELLIKDDLISSQEEFLKQEKERSRFEGELVNHSIDRLTDRVSTLEAELESKVSTLKSYEVLITSMQNELVTTSKQKEKALLKTTGSPLTPRAMEKALDMDETAPRKSPRKSLVDTSTGGHKTNFDSPNKDDSYSKILHDRDSIRNALSIVTRELVIHQDSLMQKEESCDKLNTVINELNLALIDANEKLKMVESEKDRLKAQYTALEMQRNSVQIVCGCFARRR